jgi:hypothetical protein
MSSHALGSMIIEDTKKTAHTVHRLPWMWASKDTGNNKTVIDVMMTITIWLFMRLTDYLCFTAKTQYRKFD